MLEKFKKFESLGTPKYLSELCSKLAVNKKRTQKNVKEYFLNRIIDGRYIFDWWLFFLILLWIIQETNGILSLDEKFLELINNQEQFNKECLKKIFEKLEADKIFDEIFSQENMSYDIINKVIEIRNSSFTLAYSNFKQLLIDFKFLWLHPNGSEDKLIVNSEYRDMFDSKLLPNIHKRIMWLEELKKKLEYQEIEWEKAELFVIEYEKKRLGHKQNNVERISPYHAGAGYDILSCHSINSINQDRFIEVKSFSWKTAFYRTRNEVDQARIRKDDYCLYLINRDEMNNPEYEPIIIRNPYEIILKESNNRTKEIDTYYISKI